MNVRVGLIKGMQFLSQYFQIVIFNNPTHEIVSGVNHRDSADKIKQLLISNHNITVDAIYTSNSGNGINSTTGEDFSQIFIDFNINNLKKIQEKVLFVQTLDIDSFGQHEEIQIDTKGFFLFDTS
jgi:hypothetical protein